MPNWRLKWRSSIGIRPADAVTAAYFASALQKNGRLRWFLGDGINDAPALRDADVVFRR